MPLNITALCGRVTRDIELKSTNSGTSVANFTLAVDGRNDEASFISCVAFNKTAEILAKYAPKGKQLNVSGKLQQRSWEDKDGKRQSVTEVLVNEVQLLGEKIESKGEKIQDVVLEDIDEKPIDLSEIPF